MWWEAALRVKICLQNAHEANSCWNWFPVMPCPPAVLSKRENNFSSVTMTGGEFSPAHRWWSLLRSTMTLSQPLHFPNRSRNWCEVSPSTGESRQSRREMKSSSDIGASKTVRPNSSVDVSRGSHKNQKSYKKRESITWLSRGICQGRNTYWWDWLVERHHYQAQGQW